MTIHTVGVVPEIGLHHRLRIARELTGLDGQQFAREIGISANALYTAELGNSKPREITLRAWALRTGVNLFWLKTGAAPSPSGDGAEVSHPRESNPRPIHYKVTTLRAA